MSFRVFLNGEPINEIVLIGADDAVVHRPKRDALGRLVMTADGSSYEIELITGSLRIEPAGAEGVDGARGEAGQSCAEAQRAGKARP